MITPDIQCYIKLERVINANKETPTPRYDITAFNGFYPPIEQLKNPKGQVYFYLKPKQSDKSTVPPMSLQGKDSINITGLKDYYLDGKISGFAYGEPPKTATYSKDEKVNPFFDYRNDGFLFIVQIDKDDIKKDEAIKPSYIEMIVIKGGRVLASSYLKQLMLGGFDEELKQLRLGAKPIFDYNIAL